MSAPMYTSKVARGAASEMIACAHLMARGYHVFRAVAASCPVDLIACKDDQTIRVEVKSLGLKWFSFPWPTNEDWDLLLVVGDSGDVHEFDFGITRPAAIRKILDSYGVTSVHAVVTAGLTLTTPTATTSPTPTVIEEVIDVLKETTP